MELRQLKYFVKAAETLNFTEASREVHISQSTLSQQIQQLELDLKSNLFHRIGKKVILTTEGKIFYSYAKQAIEKAELGKKLLFEMNNLQAGELHFGITYALREPLIKAIALFNATYPNIKIQVTFGTTNELIEKLKTYKLDFVASFLDANYKDDELTIQPIIKAPLVFVQSKTKPLIHKKQVVINDLSNIPLALPEKGFSTRQYLDQLFLSKQIKPNISVEINDIASLFRLIEIGQWATVTSSTTINPNQNLMFLPIKSNGHIREASIIELKDSYHNNSITKFKEIFKQSFDA